MAGRVYLARLGIVATVVATYVLVQLFQDNVVNTLLGALPWENSESLDEALTLGLIVVLLYFFPAFRNIGSFKLRWSWAALILAALLMANLLFLDLTNIELLSLSTISIAIGATFAGLSEELTFRGFCFLNNGESTPRFTVFFTALLFSSVHILIALGGIPLGSAIGSVLLAFAVGIVFGIIRVATGSLLRVMIFHSLINVTSRFASKGEAYYDLTLMLLGVVLVSSVVLLLSHPSMRRSRNLRK
jgi:membrane protease YdiL (CAAX protease family)